MNLMQRILIWMGCNALILLWIQPPAYQVLPDGTRHDHNLVNFWELPPDWSVNIPLMALRLVIIVLVTLGFFFVFKTNHRKEHSS